MNRRTKRGNGCPYCSGHRVYVGFNNFFIDFPHLEKEWDYKKIKALILMIILRDHQKRFIGFAHMGIHIKLLY